MSKDSLKSMLDEMLTDAGARARDEQQQAKDVARVQAVASAGPSTGKFTDAEELRDISGVDLVRILRDANRDDVLTVLSGASDGLRRKLLTSLSAESVRWLQQNLAYFDEPTRALLQAGRDAVLKIANRLVGEAVIAGPPQAQENASGGEGGRLTDKAEALGGVAVELLSLVKKHGREALSNVVGVGDPMLDAALPLIAQGAGRGELSRSLDALKETLLARYSRELDLVRECALAVQAGEDPEAFRRRFGTIAG